MNNERMNTLVTLIQSIDTDIRYMLSNKELFAKKLRRTHAFREVVRKAIVTERPETNDYVSLADQYKRNMY